MKQYLGLLRKILEEGEPKSDRTGTGTLSLFGETLRFDLREGFPLLTTKKVYFKGAAAELLWILSGSTNAYALDPKVQSWWLPWAMPSGDLGPIYGAQLRYCHPSRSDQLRLVVDGLRENPDSRRHVISLWHTPDLPYQQLPCCHGTVIQFYVTGEGRLSCYTHQRSADVFIGLPVNLCSYALLTSLIALELGLEVGEMVYSLGDAHLYLNHTSQAEMQLSREPKPLPTLRVNFKPGAIFWLQADGDTKPRYSVEDFGVVGYTPDPAIPGKVAV